MGWLDTARDNIGVIVVLTLGGIFSMYLVTYFITKIFGISLGIPGIGPVLSLIMFLLVIFVLFKYVLSGDLMSAKNLTITIIAVVMLVAMALLLPKYLPQEFMQSMSILGKQTMSLLGR